jgi:hypothetical protein
MKELSRPIAAAVAIRRGGGRGREEVSTEREQGVGRV